MKIKTDGIILDIDGTIWDSTEIVARAWNRAADICKVKRKDIITADLLKTQFGKPMNEIADNVFPEDSPEDRKVILEYCCRYEHEELDKDPCDIVFPGVVETIKELSDSFPFYIVSNSYILYRVFMCLYQFIRYRRELWQYKNTILYTSIDCF